MYEPRFYRDNMNTERFDSIQICVEETDLWIGVDKIADREVFQNKITSHINEVRGIVTDYIEKYPDFLTSLEPLGFNRNAHPIIQKMMLASDEVGIGPMSCIAGMISFSVGQYIEKEFGVKEVVVENGGDNYIMVENDLYVSIYAGNSKLSDSVSIIIPPQSTGLGVCTSAGKVGHSLSFGKADALTVISKDVLLADSYATGIGNKIQSGEDVEKILTEYGNCPDILALFIVIDDVMGYQGDFELEFNKKK